MKKSIVLLAIMCATCLMTGTANAVVITDGVRATWEDMWVVSNTDLINQGTSTYESMSFTGTRHWESTEYALNEGTVFGEWNINNNSGTLTPSPGDVLVVTLNTTVNALGYDITNIDTYSGAGGDCGARIPQWYKLEASMVGSSDFFEVFTLNDSSCTDDWRVLKVSISGDNGALLAGGVDQLRWTFLDDGTTEPFKNYREFDVFGSATVVPEPSAILALAMGASCLAALRRYRRR